MTTDKDEIKKLEAENKRLRDGLQDVVHELEAELNQCLSVHAKVNDELHFARAMIGTHVNPTGMSESDAEYVTRCYEQEINHDNSN